MPKFIVTYQEFYSAYPQFVVEARDEQEAEDIANQLMAKHETPVEEIEFVEWEWNETQPYEEPNF